MDMNDEAKSAYVAGLRDGGNQERDKISRWLRAKAQNLHAASVTSSMLGIGRDFCAKMLIQIAAEIEAGSASDFTPRDM